MGYRKHFYSGFHKFRFRGFLYSWFHEVQAASLRGLRFGTKYGGQLVVYHKSSCHQLSIRSSLKALQCPWWFAAGSSVKSNKQWGNISWHCQESTENIPFSLVQRNCASASRSLSKKGGDHVRTHIKMIELRELFLWQVILYFLKDITAAYQVFLKVDIKI